MCLEIFVLLTDKSVNWNSSNLAFIHETAGPFISFVLFSNDLIFLFPLPQCAPLNPDVMQRVRLMRGKIWC